jgi:hypothetical protein
MIVAVGVFLIRNTQYAIRNTFTTLPKKELLRMKIPSQKISGASSFGLAWLLVNAVGWGLGFGLQLMTVHSGGEGSLSILFGTLVSGGVIGLAQWLALRWLVERLRPGSMAIAWVILTMFGFAIGFTVGSVISGMVDPTSSPIILAVTQFVAWGVVGSSTGILQWMAFQPHLRGALWWIGMSGLGYGLGNVLLSTLRFQFGASPYLYAVGGLVAGAATLVAIARLRLAKIH